MRSILVVCLALILSVNAVGKTPEINVFPMSESPDSLGPVALFTFEESMTTNQVIVEMIRAGYVPAHSYHLYRLRKFGHEKIQNFPVLALGGGSSTKEGVRVIYAQLGSIEPIGLIIPFELNNGDKEEWGPYWRFLAVKKPR